MDEPSAPPPHAPGPITFRRLVEDDLPLLHRWLNEPGIVRWWEGEDVSWETVQRGYGPDSDTATEHWLAVLGRRPCGWIQCYPVAAELDEPEIRHWLALGVPRTAAGIDYLIGDPEDRGQGLGSAMIRAFVAEIVFGQHPGWTQACASPLAGNVASWRALENAGFTFVGSFEDADGPCRLMALDRHGA